jgi:hypothetical protein
MVRRIWPGSTIVDLNTVTAGRGAKLIPGGPLFILAPVTWLGEHAARVRLAVYPDRLDSGVEYYMFLQYRVDHWQVVRLERGWQN